MTTPESAIGASPAVARSQTDVVIDGIKALITSGTIGPGSRLPVEKDLAHQLGVSRGSLREGVRALAILGVLDTRQGDGTYVTSLDPAVLLSPLGFLVDLQTPDTASHLLAVRRVLEAESVSRAALLLTGEGLDQIESILQRVDTLLQAHPEVEREAFIRADADFHHAIAVASGNPALAGLIDTLIGRTFRARLWRAVVDQASVLEAHLEHKAIFAELRAGDPERARIRMSAHVLDVEEFMADHLAEETTSSGRAAQPLPAGNDHSASDDSRSSAL